MAHDLHKRLADKLREIRDHEDKDVPIPSSLDPATARIVRLYLERAARRVERYKASDSYMTALRIASRIVRESKPD
jgi:hypothetical protein